MRLIKLAAIAYEGYQRSLCVDPLPPFKDLPQKIQRAWEAAADAIINAMEADDAYVHLPPPASEDR